MFLQLRFFVLILLAGLQFSIRAQNDSTSLFKPYLLSNHPFGMFTSRINHNFNLQATQKKNISFSISRGNVWLPIATNKVPIHQTDRDILSEYEWHHRNYQITSRNITDFETRTLEADGIFSSYYFQVNQPLADNWDAKFNLKLNSITGGKVPVAFLTSDEVIEWFHSNIAGGNDAFGRKKKAFGLGGFYFQDEDKNEITIDNNSFLLSEISADWNWYPKIESNGIKSTGLIHTGVSKANKTYLFNLGASASAIKRWHLKKRMFDLGVSTGILAPSVFQKMPFDFNNKGWLGSLEIQSSYFFPHKSNWFITGVNFNGQSSFHKMSERNFNVIESDRLSSHGHMAVSHLNRGIQGWTFVFSYQVKKFTISTFFREDFYVDNAPDVQVGWGFNYVL
ncbi:hypothetical protein N9Q76_02190 [Flavobacteriales bacterium]|nr:hypothetical protein [Flavobacteriales bacterium]